MLLVEVVKRPRSLSSTKPLEFSSAEASATASAPAVLLSTTGTESNEEL